MGLRRIKSAFIIDGEIYMVLYVGIAAFFLINTLFQIYARGFEKYRNILMIFGGLFIIFIAGCRYGIEEDYWSYYRIFNSTINIKTLEVGFSALIGFVRVFTSNYNVFLIIVAVISLGIKLRVFYRYRYAMLMVLCYYLKFFVVFEMNSIRQGIAVAFVLLAIQCLLDKNNKGFYIYTVLAALFHVSSIFILVCVKIKDFKINKKRLYVICICAIMVRLFILQFIVEAGRIWLPNILSSSSNFIMGTQYIFNNGIVEDVTVFKFLRVVIPLYALFYIKNRMNDEKYNYLFNIYLFGAVLNIVFLGYDTISFRLAAVFCIVEPLVIGYSLDNGVVWNLRKIDVKKCIAYGSIVACNVWSFSMTLATSKALIPYEFFW